MSDNLTTFREAVSDAILAAYPSAKLVNTGSGVYIKLPAIDGRRSAGLACHMNPKEQNPAKAGTEAAELALSAYRGDE